MNQSCFARFSSRLLIAVVISASTPVGAEINAEQAQSTQAPDNYENEQYKVGSGDLLKITIFNQEELSGEYLINGAGQIALPLIGDINAKDITVKQV